MTLRKLLLLVFVFGVFANAAYAANRYVRPGASGNNTGTDWTNAYTSLPSTLVRGDTYYLADGAYAGRTFSTPASGAAVITIKKATVASHGTDAGWNDSYGDGQASFAGSLAFTSPYWTIDGQTGGGAANKWAGSFGIKITERMYPILQMDSRDAHDITIRHVDIVGKGSPTVRSDAGTNFGLTAIGAANVTLSHYRMTGIGNCPFFLNASNFVAEHGWVVSYFGHESAHSEIASIWNIHNVNSLGDTTFRHSLFTDIQSTGGIMWDNQSNRSARLLVYGNVFYKPAGANWQSANGVIGGWTGGHDEEFHNAKVYNNTFINVDQQSLSTFPRIASNNVAYNNIFYNSQSPDFAKFAAHDYNHFINAGGTHSEPNGTSAPSGDPFVDIAGLDFRLKAATANGLSLAAPVNLDPLGKTRGGDGAWDRGAFEFGAGPPPVDPPPTTSSVSLFTTQTPAQTNVSDGANAHYELGMRFVSTAPGQIRAIRFYKAPGEGGAAHVGRIYDGGQLLASVTFRNETASGWQVQNLSTPLAIAPNKQYIVTVNTGNTHYVATDNGLASSVTNGSLSSVAGSDNNGVFRAAGSSQAWQSWSNSNYFRDVVFVPAAADQSLFTSQEPAVANVSDGKHRELGMRFVSDKAGRIKAIRFYKAPGEQGASHVGKIYQSMRTGPQLLAQVTFANETASGWQMQMLPTPLSIASGTEYIVAVNTGNTYYAKTDRGLAGRVSSGSLHSMVGFNGVYRDLGAFSWQSHADTNYFRDVVFMPLD
jgi:hypothetical protein